MRRREALTGALAFVGAGPAYASDSKKTPVVDPKVTATFEKRNAFWETLGKVDSDVIAHIISPEFLGSPSWPTARQAYVIVRPSNSMIIATDGLSDIWREGSEGTGQGFGCEVFIEVPELAGASFEDIKLSWAFRAIENFAMNVADAGGISAGIQRYGILSMELPIEDAPSRLTNSNGNVGALINMPTPYPTKLTLPMAEIDIIPLTLISARDLEKILRGRAPARTALSAERIAKGIGHKSSSKE